MIVEAKEEDLKKLGRRGFLRMFGSTAAAAVVAPTKTFVFFGDILRPKEQPIFTPPKDLILPFDIMGLVGVAGIMGAIILGMGAPLGSPRGK